MKNDFEDFLMEKHGEQYVGTDDMMPDDFNKWVQDLSVDDWIKYGDEFKNRCAYCGENKNINPGKHLAELAKFLQQQIRECQEILAKTL